MAFLILAFQLFSFSAFSAQWYASITGLPGNTGAIGSPWDLQTALRKTVAIVPGDTLWLRGGIYTHTPQGVVTGNEGYIFQSEISGTQALPIWIISYPGELARIDGGAFNAGIYAFHANTRPVLNVGNSGNSTYGKWNIWKGIEFFSSSTTARFSNADSSFPLDVPRCDGPNLFGQGSIFVNCMFHDMTAGGSSWVQNIGGGFYGCLFWNNGWQGTPHLHGHNIYTQGATSAGGLLKTVDLCLFSYPYDKNLQAYSSSSQEDSHFRITRNGFIGTAAHGGVLLGTRNGGNIDRLQDNQVTVNWHYGAPLSLYYQADASAYKDLLAANNYVVAPNFQISSWKTATITNNTFFNTAVSYATSSASLYLPWNYNRNTYYLTSVGSANWRVEGVGDSKNFAGWKTQTGYDQGSTVSGTFPTTNYVILLANAYDANRANVLIYNWPTNSTVAVNVAALGWGAGASCSLINSQDPLGDVDPATVTAANIINVDMRSASHTVAIPYGESAAYAAANFPTTFPNYGQFVLVKNSGGAPAPVTFTTTVNSVNPASGVAIQALPADNNGVASGTTSFVLTYNTNQLATLTAPATASGSNTFANWTRNGAFYSTNLAISYTNVANSIFAAVYALPPVTFTTTVNSVNPASGVAVQTSPADNGGLTNGSTSFVLTYNTNQVATLTAPATASGNTFTNWTRNGAFFSTNRVILYTNVANSIFATVYALPPPVSTNYTLTISSVNPASGVSITSTPNDNAGLGNGTTTFLRTNISGRVTTLTAPATAGGNTFTNWTRNGLTYSTSLAITLTNTTDLSFAAIYLTPPLTNYIVTFTSVNPDSGVDVYTNSVVYGTTPFTKTNVQGSVIQLEAQEVANPFLGWYLNGALYSDQFVVSFTNTDNASFAAIYYTIPPPPPPAGTPYAVASFNPSSGVSVAASPADLGGLTNGVTPFTRTNVNGATITLTAPVNSPDGHLFYEWQKNGVFYFNSLSIQFLDTSPDTYTVVYIPTTVLLTVQSTNPSSQVDIALSPADNTGASSGTTWFDRKFNVGTVATLTAPVTLLTPEAQVFQKWQLNGVDYSTVPGITITNLVDNTLLAFFTNQPPAVTNAVTNVLGFSARRRALRF